MTLRYLLDTNVISEIQKPAPNPHLVAWMERQASDRLFIASIVLGEIWRGIVEADDGRRKQDLMSWFHGVNGPRALFADRILPLDESAALIWGELVAEGRRIGRPRSSLDMQLAAIAIAGGCAVATLNLRHFLPVRDRVSVIDPTQA